MEENEIMNSYDVVMFAPPIKRVLEVIRKKLEDNII